MKTKMMRMTMRMMMMWKTRMSVTPLKKRDYRTLPRERIHNVERSLSDKVHFLDEECVPKLDPYRLKRNSRSDCKDACDDCYYVKDCDRIVVECHPYKIGPSVWCSEIRILYHLSIVRRRRDNLDIVSFQLNWDVTGTSSIFFSHNAWSDYTRKIENIWYSRISRYT